MATWGGYKGLTAEEPGRTFWVNGNVLYLTVGVIQLYICQNSFNCTPEWVLLHATIPNFGEKNVWKILVSETEVRKMSRRNSILCCLVSAFPLIADLYQIFPPFHLPVGSS